MRLAPQQRQDDVASPESYADAVLARGRNARDPEAIINTEDPDSREELILRFPRIVRKHGEGKDCILKTPDSRKDLISRVARIRSSMQQRRTVPLLRTGLRTRGPVQQRQRNSGHRARRRARGRARRERDAERGAERDAMRDTKRDPRSRDASQDGTYCGADVLRHRTTCCGTGCTAAPNYVLRHGTCASAQEKCKSRYKLRRQAEKCKPR